MKKSVLTSIFLVSFMLSFFSACDNQTIQDNIDKPTTSGYEDYRSFGLSSFLYLETSSGSYFVSLDGFIHYADRGSNNYVKLCGRPDCKHNSRDCNAYIGGTTIGLYKDHIYWWGRD